MSKTKSTKSAAAKSTEAVKAAPKAKVVQNPANATARTTYEAVVFQEGTVGGKPARLAWYGTKYGCVEVQQPDGSWAVHHDCAFGGMRAVSALEGLLDEVAKPVVVADPAVVEIVEAPIPVVEFVAPAPSADVIEVEAVIPAAPKKGGKAKASASPGSPVVEVAPAVVEKGPTVAAEPAYTTLDEVRAAHEAETRGACRASVLRALRVRAGEIALGVPAGGKVGKVKAEREASDGSLAKHMSLSEMVSAEIVKIGDLLQCRGSDITIAVCEGGTVTGNLTLNQWATSVLVGRKFNAYTNVIHVPTGKTLAQLRPE